MINRQEKIKKITIVLPAYNAERTLEKIYTQISKKNFYEIILVDDGSKDNTSSLSKKLGIKTIVHKKNKGYGANQKTLYKEALKKKADFIIMLHPDGQYNPKDLPLFINALNESRGDIILGSRIRSREEALSGGMPLYKYFSNRFLTMVQNIILDQNLSEYHTGLRAFNQKVLESLPFHKFSDDFVFDQQILVSAIKTRFKIGEISVPVRYFPDASSINFKRSVKYGLSTLYTLFLYLLDDSKIYSSKIFSKK